MTKPVQIIAAMDIGSNSLHMLLAYVDERGRLVSLKSYKKILSLGASLTKSQHLTDIALESTYQAIEKMKERAQYYRPLFIVVATHAVRVAKNNEELLTNIYKRTKLKVRIIPGEEEARLMGLAISRSFFLRDKTILCLDIGGGSTEIALYRNGKPIYLKSLELGSVTLTTNYLKYKGKNLSYEHIDQLQKAILKTLAPVVTELKKFSFKRSVICSGIGKTLAFMDYRDQTGKRLKNPDRYSLSRKSINNFSRKLSQLKQSSMIRNQWKISTNRSEIVLAGTLVLQALTEELKIPCWKISNYGIREGIVLDTLPSSPKDTK